MSDELFTIPPSQPTPLQSARRALADAENELAAAIERDLPEGDDGKSEIDDYGRAVNRFTELVKAEELKELNNRAVHTHPPATPTLTGG
jgi:hypothetical protein